MVVLKQEPEDFLVEEVPLRAWEEAILPQPPAGEAFIVLRVEKRLVSHFAMQHALRRFFKLRREADLGFAGIKDKHAITTQYATVRFTRERDELVNEDQTLLVGEGWVRLHRVGYHAERLTIGKLRGNRFTIRARVTPQEARRVEEKEKVAEQGELLFPNYFGDQRFGLTAGVHNALIGYAFVRKEWFEALRLLVENEREDPVMKAVRALPALPRDALPWVKRVSRRKRLLYLSSLQSLISNTVLRWMTRLVNEEGWLSAEELYARLEGVFQNAYAQVQGIDLLHQLMREDARRVFLSSERLREALDEHLRERIFTLTTPLPGFHAPLIPAEAWLLAQLGLRQDDFILRQLPDMPAAGGRRSAYNRIHDFTAQFEREDTVLFSFTLRTGSYATIVIDQLVA